jgi:pyrroloquinoline-quinone synthase
MESVMRDVYRLPISGYEYFTHHASSSANDDCKAPSELEDTHSAACRDLLEAYCTTDEQQNNAIDFVKKSIQLRHEHFDAIYSNYYKQGEPAFRHTA